MSSRARCEQSAQAPRPGCCHGADARASWRRRAAAAAAHQSRHVRALLDLNIGAIDIVFVL